MTWLKKALVALAALTMTGCDPQFNISGAYFPDWLACILAGLIGTWLLHLIMVRFGITPYIRPPAVVYPCLFAALTCAIWLIFFSAK